MRAKLLDILGFAAFMTLLAVIYGIAHDLVTANVAVEYFTVYHPHLVNSDSPVVMALLWGVIATWWVGLPAGLMIGAANVFGKLAPLRWNVLRRRAIIAMIILWLLAMAVLISVYLLAGLMPVHERRPTFEHDRRLIAVGMTHWFSYAGAGGMTCALIVSVLWSRKRLSKLEPSGVPEGRPEISEGRSPGKMPKL